MKNVYLKKSDGKVEMIAENVETQEELFDIICDFLDKNNIESYYLRYWQDDEGTFHCDYGSWDEFILWKDVHIFEQERN